MKTLQKKTSKQLLGKDLGDDLVLEGMIDNNKNIVYINIEHIWNTAKSIDKFIYRFMTIMTHERLHMLINEECLNSWLEHSEIGDEVVIRKLTKEPFEKEIYLR